MSPIVNSLLDNSEDPTEDAAVLDEALFAPVYSGLSLMSDSELNSDAWKLNQKQRQLFNIAHSQAKKYFKKPITKPTCF